jgi:hypothetical protein
MTPPKVKQESAENADLPVHEGTTPPEGQESNLASPEDLGEETEAGADN